MIFFSFSRSGDDGKDDESVFRVYFPSQRFRIFSAIARVLFLRRRRFQHDFPGRRGVSSRKLLSTREIAEILRARPRTNLLGRRVLRSSSSQYFQQKSLYIRIFRSLWCAERFASDFRKIQLEFFSLENFSPPKIFSMARFSRVKIITPGRTLCTVFITYKAAYCFRYDFRNSRRKKFLWKIREKKKKVPSFSQTLFLHRADAAMSHSVLVFVRAKGDFRWEREIEWDCAGEAGELVKFLRWNVRISRALPCDSFRDG